MTMSIRRQRSRSRWALRDAVVSTRGAIRGDAGFSILESMMAITVVTIVMTALTVLYANTMTSVSAARSAQTSTLMTTHAVDRAAALGGADATANRGHDAVQAQFAAAPDAVQPWLADMDIVWDSLAPSTAGANANLPTTPLTETLGTATFTTNYYVGSCERARGAATAESACLPHAAAADAFKLGTTTYIRVVVAIQWENNQCGPDGCIRIAAVLLNSSDLDPVFNLNYEPPPPPTIADCKPQISAVGDVFAVPESPTEPTPEGSFSLQVVAHSDDSRGVCEISDGVPPFTWSAAGLPEGLELRAAGQFETTGATGITSQAHPEPILYQLTVRDAFDRIVTIDGLQWTIVPTLLADQLGDQFGAVGLEVSGPALSATGGESDSGSYSWNITGLPSGITFDSDTSSFSGTPADAGEYPVTVSVVDVSDVRTDTWDFTWHIYEQFEVQVPGSQNSEAREPIDDLTLAVSGGSGEYTVADEAGSLPAGLQLTGDAQTGYVISGEPSFAGTWNVALVVTDMKTGQSIDVEFAWRVKDSLDAPSPQDLVNHIGDEILLLVKDSCQSDTDCTVTISPLPAGLVFVPGSSTIEGTISGSGTTTVSINISGPDGSSTYTFDWTVYAKPTIGPVAGQTWRTNKSINFSVPSSCDFAPCTFSAEGLPAGVTLDSGTGKVSGTPTVAGTGTATITVVDAGGATATATMGWMVYDKPTIGPLSTQFWSSGGSINFSVPSSCDFAPCTFSANGLPSGVTIGASNGTITGRNTLPSWPRSGWQGRNGTATLTITDAGGATDTATLTWRVTP